MDEPNRHVQGGHLNQSSAVTTRDFSEPFPDCFLVSFVSVPEVLRRDGELWDFIIAIAPHPHPV
jgi:hypothetical protein